MGANEDSGKRNLKSGTPKKPFIYYYFLVILAVMVLNALVFPMMEHSVEVPYSEFLKELDAGNVKDVYVSNRGITDSVYEKGPEAVECQL